MTTSATGMPSTNDAELVTRVSHLSTQAQQPVTHYEYTKIGYNYCQSGVLAALGQAQLARLDEILARCQIRMRYPAAFAEVVGVTDFGRDDGAHNCWLTSIMVGESAAWPPGHLLASLDDLELESRPLWKPIHTFATRVRRISSLGQQQRRVALCARANPAQWFGH